MGTNGGNGKRGTTRTPARRTAEASRRPAPPEQQAHAAARAGREARTKRARRYFARRPLGYGGKDYDREQVVVLNGQVNDEKLVRLGYVEPMKDDQRTFPCRHCDGTFISLGGLNAHGDRRHKPRERPVMEARRPGESDVDFAEREADFLAGIAQAEDEREQAQDQQLERVAPLNWDKTTAALDERR